MAPRTEFIVLATLAGGIVAVLGYLLASAFVFELQPVEALRPLIEAFTKPGDLVLDPFSGSGSTLAAARQLGRDWTGIELDNDHYHTASKRLAAQLHHRAAA